jgi:hypothetical protein
MNMDGLRTLKLDASFNPIEIVSWQEGLVLALMDKAFILEAYEGQYAKSQRESFQIPAVVVLKRCIKYWVTGASITCTRKNILVRDDYRCQYCIEKFASKDLTLDHVIPKSRGGGKDWSNIVACCLKCNQKKGAQTPKEANMKLIRKPRRPSMRECLHMSISLSDIASDIWRPYLG